MYCVQSLGAMFALTDLKALASMAVSPGRVSDVQWMLVPHPDPTVFLAGSGDVVITTPATAAIAAIAIIIELPVSGIWGHTLI